MKLAEYLEAKKIKKGDFARDIGVTAGWVTCLCDGSGWPSQDVAERIVAVTNGDVTPNDFIASPPTDPNQQGHDDQQPHADDRPPADMVDAHD